MAMKLSDLQIVLGIFDKRVRKVFSGRPYWLITEGVVRSLFVDALFASKLFDSDLPRKSNAFRPSHLVFEAPVGGRGAIDLVASN